MVDRDVEAVVSAGFLRLIPDSVVVGEERCAAEPHWIDRVGDGIVWLVNPLDGTANFIAGRPRVVDGRAARRRRDGGGVDARPVDRTMHRAERNAGRGANDERVAVPAGHGELRRGIVKTRFLPEAFKAEAARALAASTIETQAGSNCAGADYPEVAGAASDFALYWRTLPWDHAPGTLFLTEAGGHAARLDGSAYRPAERRGGPLAARSRCLWDQAQALFMRARPPSETWRSAPGRSSS